MDRRIDPSWGGPTKLSVDETTWSDNQPVFSFHTDCLSHTPTQIGSEM